MGGVAFVVLSLTPLAVGTAAAIGLPLMAVIQLLVLWPVWQSSGLIADHDWAVFGNQLLNLLGANLDYAVVAWVLGAEAFAVYVTAFRIASGPSSIAASTIPRLVVVRISALHPREWSNRLASWVRLSLVGSVLVGVALAAIAPVLGRMLGPEWTSTVVVIQILALLTPLRVLHAYLVAGFIAARADRSMLGLELVRVPVTVLGLAIFARFGLVSLSVATVGMAVVALVVTWFFAKSVIDTQGPNVLQEETAPDAPESDIGRSAA